MTDLMLKSIKGSMDFLGLNYGFMRYEADPLVYPYFVGEYTEAESTTEDGKQESTFMLTGFARGSGGWQTLETAKQTIEDFFGREGTPFFSTTGTCCVVAYGYSFPVPKEEIDLKSIQINLTVTEWKV